MDRSYLNECLRYDASTGALSWNERPVKHFHSERYHKRWNALFAGKPAGSSRYGYHMVSIDGKNHRAHRLIFIIMTGSEPKGVVDHINGVKSDNRWSNLRDTSRGKNMQNQKLYSSNTSGASGVYWRKERSKWLVKIQVKGKIVTVGSFADYDDAISARNSAYKENGFTERHGVLQAGWRTEPPQPQSSGEDEREEGGNE